MQHKMGWRRVKYVLKLNRSSTEVARVEMTENTAIVKVGEILLRRRIAATVFKKRRALTVLMQSGNTEPQIKARIKILAAPTGILISTLCKLLRAAVI